MKRIFALLVAVLMLLCACSSEPAQTTGPAVESTADTTADSVPEETTQATQATETVEVTPVDYNPLTGEKLDAPYAGRPVAVVVNNIKACMPQSGIAGADMVFEVETEGGITRLLALFTDLSAVDKIGPVRSARTFFNNISAGYSSPLIHCGGSANALEGMYDDTKTLINWEHIDQRSNGSYFFRDQERKNQGYAYEHTLFTTGEKLLQIVAKKGYGKPTASSVDFGLQFAEEVTLQGEKANTVEVDFRGSKTTTMTYNAELGVYEAAQYGKKQIDENTGETVNYRNVLVLQAKQWINDEGYYSRSYYNLIGEGEGYFACGGQIVSIKWSRKSVTDPFVYTLADGTPLTLGIGRSYVAVISDGSNAGVTYK